MFSTRAWIFAAGVAVGVGAVCFVKSNAGRKVAVALACKGLELKECVAAASERAKETVDDVIAEARHVKEEKERAVQAG